MAMLKVHFHIHTKFNNNNKGLIMIKKIGSIILVVSLFSGCTTTPHKVSIRDEIESKVDVISVVNQQELDALFPIQNSGAVSVQFGLIGALIGSAIDASANSTSAEKATNNLSSIRNKLINYNFDELLQSNIEKSLMQHPNVSLGKVNTFKDYNDAKKQMVTGNYYLKLFSEYKLDMDFRTPFIITYASLVKKGKTDKKDDVIYKNTFTYFADSLPVPMKDEEANRAKISKLKAERETLTSGERRNSLRAYKQKIRKLSTLEYDFDESVSALANVWATSKFEQLKDSFTAGIEELTALLAQDMADAQLAETYKTNGQVLPGYPKHHKTVTVKDGDIRDVIRFSDGYRAGAICSMPNLATEGSKLVCL